MPDGWLSLHYAESAPCPLMSLLTLALIGATIVVSSFLSGVFGMAGGMVLLGVLLVFFDVAAGMILFSIIQFFANGWRALQWWEFVRWRIFWFYCLGAAVAFAAMRLIEFVPDKALVYLLLGLMPFAGRAAAGARAARTSSGAACRSSPACSPRSSSSSPASAGSFSTCSSRRACSTARRRSPPRRSRRLRATCCARAYFVSFGSIGDAIGFWPLSARSRSRSAAPRSRPM